MANLVYDDDKAWEESKEFINEIQNVDIVKHILPNTSEDYTQSQESIDTNNFNLFCCSQRFYKLMECSEVEY